MEKITLKPVVKELLYKTDEVNTHFDVLTYSGTNTQEKALGSLYLVGHAKFEDEDLGYVISLVSSLAKREFYSEQALKSHDAKHAFENTLKKLNEVLDDFFKNKTLSLNIGLAAISGDQIYISKLGKFKVGLARNGEHIDVLNNIALFQKSPENERQFSNIISGRLQPGDKIFAFYPARPVTSREKMLQGVLVKESQDQFVDRMAQLAESVETFNCCGVHISMEQIKEIPLEIPTPATLTSQSSGRTAEIEPALPAGRLSSPTTQPLEKPRVIAAELSVASKGTMLRSITSAATKLKSMDRLPIHSKFRGFIIIAAIVLIPLFAVVAIRATGDSGEVKAAYKTGSENLKVIQAKLAQNDMREARALILETLNQIRPFDGEKIVALQQELETSLNSVDHISATVPVLISTLSDEVPGMVLAFDKEKPSVVYNGSELLTVNGTSYKLKDPVTATDATLYEENLYTVAGNSIYKYADALTGGTKRSNWGAPVASLQSIAIDGNLFGLTKDGKIIMYFKGEQKSEFDTGLPIDSASQIITSKNSPLLYLFIPSAQKLYALDKSNGTLQISYKLNALGELKDIAVSDDGNVWILSKDNKVWSIAVPQ